MDERQKQINSRAIAYSGIFMMICAAVSMIVKLVTTDSLGWEFWALLGSCLVMIISRRLMGDIEEPKNIMGKPLPLGSSKADKRARKLDYAIQSTVFALACTVMDLLLVGFGKDDVADYELAEILFPSLSKGATVAVTAVIAFVTMFVISYTADYLIGEYVKVRRYNQMLAQLDE